MVTTPKIFVSLRNLARISDYRFVMFSAAFFFLVSAISHWPNFGATSDITTTFWSRTNSGGIPYLTYQVPYVSYVFEYPPVSGLVIWLAGWSSGGSIYVYTTIVFLVLGAFFVLSAHLLYNFLNHLKLDHNLQWIFTIFVPSVVIFGAYNFDIIQAFFVILALYLFIVQDKPSTSATALGFAIGTKLFAIVLIPFLLQDLRTSKGIKASRNYALISLGVPGALNIPFVLLNYSNWISGYTYVKAWGLEDTFLVWIFISRSLWGTAEFVSAGLVVLSIIAIFVFLRDRPLLVRCFLAMGSFLLFSYISAPQMNLDLLPFFALVPLVPLPLFYFFEATTATFSGLWYSFPDPRSPGVVQAFALMRQIALLSILIIVWKVTGQYKIVQNKLALEIPAMQNPNTR